ncbi:MAG TPA: PfkB family carbohydrate kinase, partial [Lacipirellulaceae bacterium]|nr:PfkB family carbohydrate kinase [Lacipirellulaceae bacterium]
TPNETEAEVLTGVKVTDEVSCSRAADILLGKGIKTVIITLGGRGSYVATATSAQLVPGFKVKAVDTTAAGDTFNGALAVALAEGMPMLDAVRFANAAGAISVTRLGAQPSAPKRSEVEKLVSGKKATASRNGGHRLQGPHTNGRARRSTGAARGR